MRKLKCAVSSGFVLASLAVPVASAEGAILLGETPPSGGDVGNCLFGLNSSSVLQNSAETGTYIVPPGGGVITEWRHQANAEVQQKMRLRLFTGNGGNSYTAVKESDEVSLVPSVLNVIAVRIPVSGDEILGLGNGDPPYSSGACVYSNTPGVGDNIAASGDHMDPALNTPTNFLQVAGYKINVAAVLEPDADRDGFGDETQDQCPGTAGANQGCPDTDPPETTITKDAPKRIFKSKVKFSFMSDEAGATFECKLKGKGLDRAVKQFNDCTSPRRYKNLDPGRYRFKVQAIDPAGNVDLTPAKDRFRVLD
jgi:hypothetical protein